MYAVNSNSIFYSLGIKSIGRTSEIVVFCAIRLGYNSKIISKFTVG